MCFWGPGGLICSYTTSTAEHRAPYQTRGMGCKEENQDGPADGELHSIEAKRQGQGPPKAPSQVLPHQVGGIAVERWWQKRSEGGCSIANGGSPLTSGLLVAKREHYGLKWEQLGLGII